MKQVLRQFVPNGLEESLQPLGGGLINTTYRVTDTEGKQYVLQKINTNVFREPMLVMRNTTSVTNWMRNKLRAEGIEDDRRVLQYLPDQSGEYMYRDPEGACWRCYRLIDGTTAHLSAKDPRMLYEAGKGYGEFHRLMQGFPARMLHEVIPNFHNTKKRFEDFMEAVERDAVGRAHEVEREISFLRSREEIAGSIVDLLESGELPIRATHNDTKLSNVLLDDETGEAVCVIDLDTVMPGTVLYDFGDAIRSGAASAAEDEPKLDRVNFMPEYYDAFKQGFLEACGDILLPIEKDNLLLGARVILYEQAMRFLTDYLNGDTYFRTVFPGHNLIRARTQIRLFSQLPE